ncbi:MAG TPA: extracellular solute-binding protein [Candidatus Limnocylindrales bacterium]|nr:extracellular solute-binding protein [Candidatus Limnocylindrales bacterium]
MVIAACGGSGATTRPSTGASNAASAGPSAASSAGQSEAPATDSPTAEPTDVAATDEPSSEPTIGPTTEPSTSAGIGPGEGELNLVIWTGYAERGASDPVYDWVTPFEEETGCMVNTTDMADSNNGVSLMQSGSYDGISASGDATTRLIQGGLAAPVDTSVFTNYDAVFDSLKDLPHNTVDGVNYGVPHGRGANLLAYNTETFSEAPTSWDPIWEGGSDYAGKISIYDSSIFIADAALHLQSTQPELGITDIYQLNEEQFNAAVALLEELKANNPLYWGLAADQIASYGAGEVVVGTTWQYQVNVLQADAQPIEGVLPDEGSTGWSDTWMMSAEAAHPNCMLLWMDWMMSPEASALATIWFGEAPTSQAACDFAETVSPGHCGAFHATDEEYFSKVHYWATPQEDCADEDPATTCKTQDDWVEAWTDLRGS